MSEFIRFILLLHQFDTKRAEEFLSFLSNELQKNEEEKEQMQDSFAKLIIDDIPEEEHEKLKFSEFASIRIG